MNKRGQGLSTSTIVLIILAIIVLVILALGFILGWDQIAPWLKKDSNVDQVSKACTIACSTQSTYDFCTRTYELYEGKDKYTDTCNNFASDAKYQKYGIELCASFGCP